MTYHTHTHTHAHAHTHVASHVTLCTKSGRRRRGGGGSSVGCTNFTVSDSSTCSLTAQTGPMRAPSPPSRVGGGAGRRGLEWQAAGTKRVKSMSPSLGEVSLPQFAQSKGAGKCRKGGTHFRGAGGRGLGPPRHGESTECRVRKPGSGLPVSRLGTPKRCSPSLGPGILICKTRALEPFLPKSGVLGHAQWWQGYLPPWDVD